MHLCVGALVLALSSSLVAALAGRTAFKVKETVHIPRGWIEHAKPAPDHSIVLRIGLPQPDFHVLEKHLYEVSDPEHERYGDHLSKEDVEELVRPHPNSLAAVNKWLASHGFQETDIARSPAQDWITLRLPVAAVEQMLDTKYSVYKHLDSGDTLVRTASYSLPAELHDHIDVIQPTTMFGRLRSARSTPLFNDDVEDTIAASKAKAAAANIAAATVINPVSGAVVDASCNNTITIKCLQQLYNAVDYTPKNQSGIQIGITGYLEQYANIQDLQSFYADQRPEALNTSFKFVSVNGGQNDQNISLSGAEAALDVQFAFGLAYPIPGVFWSTAGRPPFKPDVHTPQNTNEPYADWLEYVLSQKDAEIPKSISTSYGDDEQTVPRSYAIRTCNQFAQLGARGVSIIFSSGDWGVGDGNPDPATQECQTNDGTNRTRFIPVYPASCPYVTAIGGTEGIAPEVAVSRFPSGGGFSDYFVRPPYQDIDVQNYVNALPKGTYNGLYNPLGRAFPDVAAQGDRYRIFLRGVARSIGGTSASSPAFAGLVALLNDARMSAGKKPLGFLNPLIYSAKAKGVWNDVTFGKNPGCGTQGFNATKGWDPVTGLGTMNFGKLLKIVA